MLLQPIAATYAFAIGLPSTSTTRPTRAPVRQVEFRVRLPSGRRAGGRSQCLGVHVDHRRRRSRQRGGPRSVHFLSSTQPSPMTAPAIGSRSASVTVDRSTPGARPSTVR
jgi:hypothetical protein